MKNKKTNNKLTIWATIILGVLTICAFVLQIVSANETTTQLDTALFSIIQFILSLGFGWVLTKAITKEEYEESTKKFAVGAYRRIADIDRMVTRLQNEIEKMRQDYPEDKYHALDVVKAIVVDINQTIQSSVSDWTDVIGDELLTLQKIQSLEEEKNKIINEPPPTEPNKITERLENLENSINKLASTLPPKLRYQTKETPFDHEEAAQKMIEAFHSDTGLRLNAFWDTSFEVDPCNMKKGEKVYVAVDSINRRIGALIVKNSKGKAVGVVTNNLGSSYENFRRVMGLCFYESRFSAEITYIGPHRSGKKDETQNFTIRVLDVPSYKAEDRKTKTG